jgi:CheY-like chemotaxis protein
MTRVLVVDDDPLVREAIALMAARAGHDVAEAENGAVALSHHRATPADVIVLDVLMPVLEGIETIRALRKADPDVKIIAISGGAPAGESNYLKYARNFGAHAVLSKPFRNSELLACIDTLTTEDVEPPEPR